METGVGDGVWSRMEREGVGTVVWVGVYQAGDEEWKGGYKVEDEEGIQLAEGGDGRGRVGLRMGWGADVVCSPVDGGGGDVAGVGFMTRLLGC